jgi:all-trans-retinol 13,14-reductase
MVHIPRLVRSWRVRRAVRPDAIRNTLISRVFRQGPRSGPSKSGLQPPFRAHEPSSFRVSSMSAQREFDAIVIGSGMGGLAFASIMAKLREWRVLVLERHFKIGGFTHTFTRPGGWSWDVGLHYVGEMGEGMMGRRLFDFITDGGVKWNPMPDVYDVFAYPTMQVRACKGEGNFRRALIDAFPGERACIEQYFRDLKSAVAWTHRHFIAMAAPAPLSWMVRLVNRLTADLPLRVTQQYLKRRFRDERLRAVATSQWGDYGLPPGQSAFATHAVIATHYLDGAWYPDGGAGEIAKATGAIIRAAGGELLVNHEVTGIRSIPKE